MVAKKDEKNYKRTVPRLNDQKEIKSDQSEVFKIALVSSQGWSVSVSARKGESTVTFVVLSL